MKIASHHIKGTDGYKLSSLLHTVHEYTPVCAWPDECTVQWGHGIIPAVPFFEAFLPNTFIRGEGKDITAAEAAAFDKYTRDLACDHVWGRQRPGGNLYTNGAAFCRKCGGFRSNMFPEIKELGYWRKPLSRWEYDAYLQNETDHALTEKIDLMWPHDRQNRIKREKMLRLRYNVFGKED